jgi:hypothetical protein
MLVTRVMATVTVMHQQVRERARQQQEIRQHAQQMGAVLLP